MPNRPNESTVWPKRENKQKTKEMKKIFIAAAILAASVNLTAQTSDDPVLMIINGQTVTRSEFEYSYNKNNTDAVVDKKTVDEYVDLFINYKLKVVAAEAAGIDTTKAFHDEFKMYRDQQVKPSFLNDEDLEHEAYRVYKTTQERVDSTGGLVSPSHILLMVRQKDTDAAREAAKRRADSLYQVIKAGGDFAELAKKYSDDHGTASRGGKLGWVMRGRTVKAFDDKIFSMQPGEISEPVETEYGYHIINLDGKQNFFPYDSVKNNVMRYVGQQAVRDRIITTRLDSIAKASVPATTPAELLEQRATELQATDSDMRYLIREYHDGLLLYEMMNRMVWDKASKDDKALEAYYKKHKKEYKWDKPRFKGIAYHTKDSADVAAVAEAIRNVDFDDWAETLRKQFNDSTRRIQVVKGFFKEGDNSLVDREIFKKDTVLSVIKGYPYHSTYGEIQQQPQNYKDVREMVVNDYQQQLEKEWVAELRKRYPVTVNKAVLATVNKH